MNIPYSAITPFEPLGVPSANNMLMKRIMDQIEVWFNGYLMAKWYTPEMTNRAKLALAMRIRLKLRSIPRTHGATDSSSWCDVHRNGRDDIIGFTYHVNFKINGKEYTCSVKQQFAVPTTATHWGFP